MSFCKLSLAPLLCASLLAHAEEPIHLDDVEVSADPLSASSQHIVRPVSVLFGEELDRKNKATISDLVDSSPGVSSASFGPGVGRPVIRGQSGARVGVMSDGISSMDVSSISPDHGVAISPVFVDQVEILRGPATLLYGSGASGGMVNVITNSIPDYVPEGLEGEAYGHFDSAADDKVGGLRFDVGHGEFAFHLDTVHRGSHNISIPGFELVEPHEEDVPGTLRNSDVETHDLTFGASWVHDRGFLGFSINSFDNDYGIPGHAHEHEEEHDEEHEEEGSVRLSQKQTRFDVKGELENPFAGFSLIKIRGGYNDHTHTEGEGGTIGTQLDNREWQGRVELLHNPLAGWEGVAGLQYQNRNLDTSGDEAFLPNSSLDSIGLFILERRDFDHWHAEVGGRYEFQSADSTGQISSVEHDLFSFSAGLGYHWSDDFNTRLNFTRSQRAPALEELFSNGAHLATSTFEIGSTDLNEETTHSLDLTFSKTGGTLTGEINLFASWINDFIYLSDNDRNGDGLVDRVEGDFSGDPAEIVLEDDALLLVDHLQADARFYGVELQTKLELFHASGHLLDLKLWGDFVRGKLSGGQDLPRISPWRIGTGLDYHRGKLAMYLDVTHTGRQSRLAALETSTDSYTDLSAGINYDVILNGQMNASFFLRGTNLLDEEIRHHTSFVKDVAPQQGRSVMAGIRLLF